MSHDYQKRGRPLSLGLPCLCVSSSFVSLYSVLCFLFSVFCILFFFMYSVNSSKVMCEENCSPNFYLCDVKDRVFESTKSNFCLTVLLTVRKVQIALQTLFSF